MKNKSRLTPFFAVLFILLGIAGISASEPRLEIISLKPNKIVYNDGEAGTAAVVLANPFDKELDVTLK
ncbi:MAG: hypothetical protein UW07_C0051G0007, partial [Candidatus Nomurabacteria bacterium GW2011_GWF2_43_8]